MRSTLGACVRYGYDAGMRWLLAPWFFAVIGAVLCLGPEGRALAHSDGQAAPAGTAPAETLTVRIDDATIQPGDVLAVLVAAPADVVSVSATWRDASVPFARLADGQWHALVGIDIDAVPGPAPLRVSAARTTGPGLTRVHTLDVVAKTFRTRRIRVNPKFVTPPKSALPRIADDNKRLQAIFASPLGERLWTAGAVRPVEGVAVSGFGVRSVLNGQPRGPHTGLDLAAGTGTPVYAPTPGLVVAAREFYYSGNTVILDHGAGLFSTMAHLSAFDVAEGQRVAQGALLGKVGATGRVTGPHLHWAVRLHGARVDPLSLLDALTP